MLNKAVLAAFRCAFVALYVCLFYTFDVAVVDLVSLPVLIFSLFRKRCLFYCHYPDKLLAASLIRSSNSSSTTRSSLIKRAYRYIIDAQDAFSMQCASIVVCNSQFTSTDFSTVFPSISTPLVVYPCVSVPSSPTSAPQAAQESFFELPSSYILSLNRYELKKNIALAVHTMVRLKETHHHLIDDLSLVIAGGYDARLPENATCFAQLEALIEEHHLSSRIVLLKNVSDVDRIRLLRNARAVVYTPSNEHFGIVPLEAMAFAIPVVAVRSGGPCETVVHGETGFLCDPSPDEFRTAVFNIISKPHLAKSMGAAGKKRVAESFSRDVLGHQLQRALAAILPSGQQ